jgi:hypothetical protein
VVLSKWRNTNYVREYVRHKRTASNKQIEIRTAFSQMIEIWRSMQGAVLQTTWDIFARSLNMTGFNAFLGNNANKIREGEPLELFKALGELPLTSLTAAPGASGSIVCNFTMPADSATKHVIFFSQKITENKGSSEIRMHEAGVNPTAPFTITGLDPGVSYIIYAVITDNVYASARTVSESRSAEATAGA